ncbi:right-handed parallel beta-helix repeat-containing protein [Sphingobium sp. BYY-5]|uniref:twin-arginine translocation signal domain-containing protein n=1 Tax=Sphingobium sp. BYY-5 TaxID=2926400 RepID=UPI001FA79725|nr:twin-arginine translocation signal domain-containing protein [Sphingobium sp. BYY-5]MCI4592656.1 right-handed parallel beta-helix repeat-containing protein [Sphingobium sp. BYY-5]
MTALLTRRRFMKATAAGPAAVPSMIRAQTGSQTLIDGRTFRGTRLPDGSGVDGGTAIWAESDTLIRNCHFLNLGNGAIRLFHSATANFTIEDCDVSNMYRFIENWSWDHPSVAAPVSDFAIRRVVATGLERNFLRIRYGSTRGVIEDVVAHGNGQCSNYCVGFALDDEANDIVYRRVEAHDFSETRRAADRYWNGDGFSDERGNRQIRYYSCVATGCSDGGFDVKSAGVYLEDCRASGNKRNYRLWNSGILKNCRSENPVKNGGTGEVAHFAFFGGSGANYMFDRPVVRAAAGNTAPIFFFQTDTPATISIYDADIDAPDAPLIQVDGPAPTIQWFPDRSQQKIRVARDMA